MGLTVIIITKNEAKDLPQALASVAFADEIVIVDSGSSDGTQEIAESSGARLFETESWPGFGPQKNLALDQAREDWVLSLDADEWVTPELALEIQRLIKVDLNGYVGPRVFKLKRKSIFIDRLIKWGDWSGDRVTRLFIRNTHRFTDSLVHERLVPIEAKNDLIGELQGTLMHNSVASTEDAFRKMRQYGRLAARKLEKEGRGSSGRAWLHGVFTLFRGLVLRLGILDGRRGFQLAWANANGSWLKYHLAGRRTGAIRRKLRPDTRLRQFLDWGNLLLTDHGCLRLLYSNRWRLSGGMFRGNQPSPSDLEYCRDHLGVRTIINLRGDNPQLGWYRLEKIACKDLGLTLINFKVYSRGLIEKSDFLKLKKIIDEVELPAFVHCKSGADRAGFFSVLFRHYRLGDPIENAVTELGLRFGHFKGTKTGILDYFFQRYLSERRHRESLSDWIDRDFRKDKFDSSYVQRGIFSGFLVDKVLRRE